MLIHEFRESVRFADRCSRSMQLPHSHYSIGAGGYRKGASGQQQEHVERIDRFSLWHNSLDQLILTHSVSEEINVCFSLCSRLLTYASIAGFCGQPRGLQLAVRGPLDYGTGFGLFVDDGRAWHGEVFG